MTRMDAEMQTVHPPRQREQRDALQFCDFKKAVHGQGDGQRHNKLFESLVV